MDRKPIIFTITGESGSGKTMIAETIEELAGIPMIASYTTRKPRFEGEQGHVFISNKEFDSFKPEDMLFLTQWGDVRYCCLKKDLKPVNTYVIDCKGAEELKACKDYEVYAIRIRRPEFLRIESVGVERVKRDEGRFYLPDTFFDLVVENISDTKFGTISSVWNFMCDKF